MPLPPCRSILIVFASWVIVIGPAMPRMFWVVPVPPVEPFIGAGFLSASGAHLPLKLGACAESPVAKTTAASTLNVIARRRIYGLLLGWSRRSCRQPPFIIDQMGRKGRGRLAAPGRAQPLARGGARGPWAAWGEPGLPADG